MTMVKIGLAQARQTASLERNAETILRFVEEAGAAGVQILCFPEGQTAGYRGGRRESRICRDRHRARSFQRRRGCGEMGAAVASIRGDARRRTSIERTRGMATWRA
jgi:predicted amidohydrolase